MKKILDILIYIMYILANGISISYIIYISSKVLNKVSYSYKKIITTSLIMCFAATINNWLLFTGNLNFLKPIIATLAVAIALKYIYKNSNRFTIIALVIMLIASSLLDLGTILVLKFLNKDITTVQQSVNVPNWFYLINSLVNVLSISLVYVFCFLTNRLRKTDTNSNFYNSNLRYISYQGSIILICLIPSIILIFSNKYNYSIPILITTVIQLLTVSIFAFIYVNKRFKHKATEIELENSKLHIDALSTINEGVRGFKHDMANMVQSMNGYIAMNNFDGIKEYINSLSKGFNDINILSILSPEVINDPAIYGIVVGKMLKAREYKINLSLDINLRVSEINFPKFELSRIIGILLDNAIEAAVESEDKKLIVNMYHNEKKKADIIVIGNSVKDIHNIDITKIFDKNYSTKAKASGFGLYEVLRFFKKYNKGDIVTNLDCDKSLFYQTIVFSR
ncbi:MAG: GHKL domain-containing protein [Clostridia bacterium]|nr:GHKL domain-containing protein [Clostridia bacterium]MDD4375693.1 GHKL domain-containing protein [Clostridia bacterium]